MNVIQQTKWLAYGEAFDTEHDARRFHEAYDVAKVYYESDSDALSHRCVENPRALAYLFYDAFSTLDEQRREATGKVISPTDKAVNSLAAQVVTLETKLAELILAADDVATILDSDFCGPSDLKMMRVSLQRAVDAAQSDIYLEGVSHD